MSQNTLSRVSSDQKLVDMWLHGRPDSTQKEYCRDIQRFLSFVRKPVSGVALEDLQEYALHLQEKGLKATTLKRKLNTVKSLFTFATKLNYVRFNVAAALRMPKADSSLANRILKQSQVLKLIQCANDGRDKSLLKLIYATGMRVSEVCRLKWSDFNEREDGEVQVTVIGKGNKVRVVIVPATVWLEIEALRTHIEDDEPVFRSVRDRQLDRTMVHKIVKDSAKKAGINPSVSSHWLRHCHASHALQKGASIALVRDSLGHSSVAITDRYLHSVPSDSSGNYLGL
jgi:integrase/recombinase XerD